MNCNDWLQKTKENSYCFILSKENLLAHCILATGFVARVAPIVRPINSKSNELVAICHFILKIYQRTPETLWIFIYKRMAIFIATENENETLTAIVKLCDCVRMSTRNWMILTKIEQMFMVLIHRMASVTWAFGCTWQEYSPYATLYIVIINNEKAVSWMQRGSIC